MDFLRKWIDSPLSGGRYAACGIALGVLKFGCDRLLAYAFFHRTWQFVDYWRGGTSIRLFGSGQDAAFVAAMLCVAIPFMALGVGLTLRRLQTLNLSPWLVCFFFVPFMNFPFFAALFFLQPMTSRAAPVPTSGQGIGRFIPESGVFGAIGSAAGTALLTVALVALNSKVFKGYGWGLFVFLPFVHGLALAWTYGYHRQRSFERCLLVLLCSCMLAAAFMAAFLIEGAICIAMAAPLWFGVAVVGAAIGWRIQIARWQRLGRTLAVLVCLAAAPFAMGAERALNRTAPLLESSTVVDIQASPEVVWRHVVSFSELPRPTEWVFKTGLAYPIRARIEGAGVGAIRHCEFSTGVFVEPIEAWDPPSLLRFSVLNTPSPMEEMSLYSHIEPPHLHGYMVSRRGQFRLGRLPGGGTRLEGTTWYEHNLWPAAYWEVWSDYIIHRIHGRVLAHIKNLSESEAAADAAKG